MIDVSIITIDKKPAIEIVIDNKVCVFKTTQEMLEKFKQSDAKELVKKCKTSSSK